MQTQVQPVCADKPQGHQDMTQLSLNKEKNIVVVSYGHCCKGSAFTTAC